MTGNSTNSYPSNGIHFFEIISILIMCILGVFGNILVVLVVYKQSKMRTVTNYFIVNLAIADLFVLLINVPLDLIVKLSSNRWLYGAAMCKLIPPFQTMSTTVSVWSLVAISIGRYIAIVYPLRPQLQTRHAKWIISIVWIIGFVVVIPFMLALEIRDGKCQEDFESAGMVARAFTIEVFIAQYIVPLSVIIVCYVRVGIELSRSGKGHENSELIKEQRKETKKVVKILRVVVTAFAILVLPIHLLYIWIDFYDGFQSPKLPILKVVAVVMLYSNSASNPILYNICNDQFREGFKQYFKPCSKTLCPAPGLTCKEEYSNSNETKDTEFMSLVYKPKTKLSDDVNQNGGCQEDGLNKDDTCLTVMCNNEEQRLSKVSDCSLV